MDTISLSRTERPTYDLLRLSPTNKWEGLWFWEPEVSDKYKDADSLSHTIDSILMSSKDLKNFAQEIHRVVSLKPVEEKKLDLTFFGDNSFVYVAICYIAGGATYYRDDVNNKFKLLIGIKSLYTYESIYNIREENQYLYLYGGYNTLSDFYTGDQLLSFASRLETEAKKAENIHLPSPEDVFPKIEYPDNMIRLLMFGNYHYHFLRITPEASNEKLWRLEIGKWYKNKRLNKISDLTSKVLLNQKDMVALAGEVRGVLSEKPFIERNIAEYQSHPLAAFSPVENKPRLSLSLIFRFDQNMEHLPAQTRKIKDAESNSMQLRVGFNKAYANQHKLSGDACFLEDEQGNMYTFGYFLPEEMSLFADQLEQASGE